jgi:reversion-inducing-cysteine-rich protein with kazal motifs
VGVVCGVDGQSHLSECAALAARVAVDYWGPCVAVGRGGEWGAQCGDGVRCPEGATGPTPPGACCPARGAAVRMLVSTKQAVRAAQVAPEAATVSSVLTALEGLVPTAECRVLGHLSVEADLWVTVSPVPARPTPLQLAACEAEATKLAVLVQTAGPRLASQLSLSLLMAAAEVPPPQPSSATFTSVSLPLLFICVGWSWRGIFSPTLLGT